MSVFASKVFWLMAIPAKGYYAGTVLFPLHGVHFSVQWEVVLGLLLIGVLSLSGGGRNMAKNNSTKFCIILVRINPIIPKVSCPWWVNT